MLRALLSTPPFIGTHSNLSSKLFVGRLGLRSQAIGSTSNWNTQFESRTRAVHTTSAKHILPRLQCSPRSASQLELRNRPSRLLEIDRRPVESPSSLRSTASIVRRRYSSMLVVCGSMTLLTTLRAPFPTSRCFRRFTVPLNVSLNWSAAETFGVRPNLLLLVRRSLSRWMSLTCLAAFDFGALAATEPQGSQIWHQSANQR